MSKNSNLSQAKNAKNDEFYTQYADIQKEVNAYLEYDPNVFRDKTVLLPCDDPEWSNFTKFFVRNFASFGLKKLISTSFAAAAKNYKHAYQPSLFEQNAPQFDKDKTEIRGKIFVLTGDTNKNGVIDEDDLEWEYLKGTGDFRSPEVCKLRDEADIIVTNPPFSLFREFLAWIVGDDASHGDTETRSGRARTPTAPKKFLIIGNMNAITYKEVFPLIKDNKLWLGNGFSHGNAFFRPVGDTSGYAAGVFDATTGLVKFRNVCWFTNLDHGRRHQPLSLMTEQDNIKHSKHKEILEKGYVKYDNYDAIEIPYTDAIPKDYHGVMGVPISFLDKYCPEQFEILDARDCTDVEKLKMKNTFLIKDADGAINGKPTYARILIRHKKETKK